MHYSQIKTAIVTIADGRHLYIADNKHGMWTLSFSSRNRRDSIRLSIQKFGATIHRVTLRDGITVLFHEFKKMEIRSCVTNEVIPIVPTVDLKRTKGFLNTLGVKLP